HCTAIAKRRREVRTRFCASPIPSKFVQVFRIRAVRPATICIVTPSSQPNASNDDVAVEVSASVTMD
ncbi:hypothetical protein ABI063_14920, partial [Enterococcus faecium]|uniref:hypothetical protein n=1 Tax=Enterococcus faecium TaxID=1352 RepID=UPI003F429E71